MTKTRRIVSIILNAIIFISEVIVFITNFSYTYPFRLFTNLSNYLIGIISLINVIINIIHYQDESDYKSWFYTIKIAGTTLITITFVTVLLYLGPVFSYSYVYSGTLLYTHLLLPVAFIFDFIIVVKSYKYSVNTIFLGPLLMLVYGAVYLSCVILFKVWPDFYQFNYNGMWPITLIVLFALATGLSFLYRFLKQKVNIKF